MLTSITQKKELKKFNNINPRRLSPRGFVFLNIIIPGCIFEHIDYRTGLRFVEKIIYKLSKTCL